MGNTIKNYEKKRRKEQREAYREMRQIVHDSIMTELNLPHVIKEKEAEIFDALN